MSEDAITGERAAIFRRERNAAMTQLGDLRANLRLIGEDLQAKGSCLVEADALDLVVVARELVDTAMRLRTISVELNSATTVAGQRIADEARGRGYDI